MIRNLFFAMQGFRLCGGEEGAMKTDEVCGRPLDPFALHTHVTGLLSQQKGFRACGRDSCNMCPRNTVAELFH